MTARALPVLLLLAACTDSALLPPRPATKTVQSALDVPEGYLPTPYGWYHSSCIHHVPKGTIVDQKNAPRCAFPRLIVDTKVPNTPAPPPETNGWQIDTDLHTSAPAIHMTSVFQVPSAPSMLDGQLDYFFPGMVPAASGIILQPVLQYGVSPVGGGNKWGIASWSCDTETSGTCNGSDLFDVSPGDVLLGTIDGTNCTGQGNCDWAIVTTDLTNGSTTTLNTTGDTHTYTWLFTGVLEAYGVTRCADYPANGSEAFSHVVFTDPTGAVLTGNWGTDVGFAGDPANCPSMTATTTDTSALLVFTDKTLPTVSLAPGDGMAMGPVQLTATATPGSGSSLMSVTITQNGVVLKTGNTPQVDDSFDTTQVANGPITFAATAADADGAAATAYSTINVLNPPTVTLSSSPTVDTVVPIVASATPPMGTTVTSVEIAYDGGVVASGSSGATWQFDTGALDNATQVLLVATAKDADGSKGSATLTLTVANAPTVTLSVPPEGNGMVGIDATSTPAKGTSPGTIEIDVDGQKVASGSGAATLHGTWDSRLAANGSTHTVTASATDSDNLSSSAAPAMITVKNVPQVTVTSPMTSEAGKPYLISVAATAPVGTTVTSLTLSLDGEQAATSATGSLSFTFKTDPKQLGLHQLVANAIASDGTTGTSTMSFDLTKATGCGCEGSSGVMSIAALGLLLLRRRARAQG